MSDVEKLFPSAEKLAKLRDSLQACAGSIDEILHHLSEQVGVIAVKEETFNVLAFDKQQGAKIGEYEVGYKDHNLPDKWVHPYNILNQNKATINNRYHGEGYVFSYWLYGENKIYRQKLKQGAQ
jgi:hypothetical protein